MLFSSVSFSLFLLRRYASADSCVCFPSTFSHSMNPFSKFENIYIIVVHLCIRMHTFLNRFFRVSLFVFSINLANTCTRIFRMGIFQKISFFPSASSVHWICCSIFGLFDWTNPTKKKSGNIQWSVCFYQVSSLLWFISLMNIRIPWK